MKKEKRIKKQLTRKQAGIISMVISVVFGIIMFFIMQKSDAIKKEGAEYFFSILMCCLVMPLLSFVFCQSFIFKVEQKEHNELQAEVKTFLSKEKFTELIFTPKNNDSETNMLLGILQKEGCRFFAKLDENENTILFVYDKDDKEVWKEEIVNYFYFEARFKQKK